MQGRCGRPTRQQLCSPRRRPPARRDIPLSMIRQFLVGALNWLVDWYDPRRVAFDHLAAQVTAIGFDGIVSDREAAS